MESRQPTPINGRLNQQYRRKAVNGNASGNGPRANAALQLPGAIFRMVRKAWILPPQAKVPVAGSANLRFNPLS
jgi:hypothetical protein